MPKDNSVNAELEIIVAAQKSQIQKMKLRIDQLDEASKNKEAHMQSEIARYRHIEDSARNLCIKILGKDRGEMVLGTEYTWNKVETEELIADALRSYRKYCEDRTEHLQRLHDYAIEYAEKYQEAQSELQALQQDVDAAIIKKDRDQVEKGIKEFYDEKVKNGLIPGYNNGNVVVEDQEEEIYTDIAKRAHQESSKDIAEESMRKIQSQSEDRLIRSGKLPKNKLTNIEKQQIDAITPDVIFHAEGLSESEAIIIKALGQGFSRRPKIKQETNLEDSTFYKAIKSLAKKAFVESERISYGSLSNVYIDALTLTGKQAYKHLTGEYPAVAECKTIKGHHHTLEHGYGILACMEVLNDYGHYSKINMYAPPIDLKNGTSFTPDLMCKLKEEYVRGESMVDIFEYETMSQKDTEYNGKFNKMALVGDDLNFILRNSTLVIKLHSLLYNWAQAHKDDPHYRKKYIRISGFGHFEAKAKEHAAFDDLWVVKAFLNELEPPQKDS